MSGSRLERVSGRALALRGDDVDTDRIVPARFLVSVTFEGLEAAVFADDRKALAAAGGRHPFDDPARREASILVVNRNFGCGSSREHAPQALARRGIRAVVAESFSGIFFGNAVVIGLPCVTLAPPDVTAVQAAVEGDAALEWTLDLRAGTLEGGGLRVPASLPPAARDAFLTGAWDGTSLLLDRFDEVEALETRLPYRF